jgi:hypothetical protein
MIDPTIGTRGTLDGDCGGKWRNATLTRLAELIATGAVTPRFDGILASNRLPWTVRQLQNSGEFKEESRSSFERVPRCDRGQRSNDIQPQLSRHGGGRSARWHAVNSARRRGHATNCRNRNEGILTRGGFCQRWLPTFLGFQIRGVFAIAVSDRLDSMPAALVSGALARK